jgi:hypothetical protein
MEQNCYLEQYLKLLCYISTQNAISACQEFSLLSVHNIWNTSIHLSIHLCPLPQHKTNVGFLQSWKYLKRACQDTVTWCGLRAETSVGCSNMILVLQCIKVQQSLFHCLCCQNIGYLTMLYDLQKSLCAESAERVIVHTDMHSTVENVGMTYLFWLMEAVKPQTTWWR